MAQTTQTIISENISSIKELRAEINALKDSLVTIKEGTNEWAEKTTKLHAAQSKLDNINKAAKGTLVQYDAAQKNSINYLKQRIKQLETERSSMDMSSKEYKKVTKELKSLNDALREAGTSAGNWRANVGNYAQSISGAFSQLGSSVQGVSGQLGAINSSMLTLAKNPLGAAVLALVAAIGLLTKGITSSEENLNHFQQTVAPIKALFVTLTNACQDFAKKVLDLIDKFKQTETYSKVVQGAFKGVAFVVESLKSSFENIKEGVTGIIESVGNAIGRLKEWAAQLASTFQPVVNFITDIKDAIKSQLEPVIDWVIEKYNQIAQTNVGKALGLQTINEIKKNWDEAGKAADVLNEKLDKTTKAVANVDKARAAYAKNERARKVQLANLEGELAEVDTEVAALKLAARQTTDYQERLEVLGKALDKLNEKKEIQAKINAINLASAKEDLKVKEMDAALTGNDAAVNDALAEAKANVIRANNRGKQSITAITTAMTELASQSTEAKKAIDAMTEQERINAFRTAVTQLNAELKDFDTLYQESLNELGEAPEEPEQKDLNTDTIDEYYDAVAERYQAEYDAYAAMIDGKIDKMKEFIEAQAALGNDTTVQEKEISKLQAQKAKEYIALQQEQKAVEKDRLKAQRQNYRAQLSAYSALMESMTELFGENTLAYKASATAKAIIDTYLAANAVLAEQQGGYIARAVAMAATIASGIANVIAIWKTDTSGASGASGISSSASVAAISTPTVADSTPYSYSRTLQTEEEEEKLNQPIYVSVTDINNVQNKVKVREKNSTF